MSSNFTIMNRFNTSDNNHRCRSRNIDVNRRGAKGRRKAFLQSSRERGSFSVNRRVLEVDGRNKPYHIARGPKRSTSSSLRERKFSLQKQRNRKAFIQALKRELRVTLLRLELLATNNLLPGEDELVTLSLENDSYRPALQCPGTTVDYSKTHLEARKCLSEPPHKTMDHEYDPSHPEYHHWLWRTSLHFSLNKLRYHLLFFA